MQQSMSRFVNQSRLRGQTAQEKKKPFSEMGKIITVNFIFSTGLLQTFKNYSIPVILQIINSEFKRVQAVKDACCRSLNRHFQAMWKRSLL